MPYDLPIYEFDEERDLKHYRCWILGAMWFPPPFVPLFIDLHDSWFKYGMQYAANRISAPGSKGWDWRIYRGASYFSAIETTEEERKQREPVFREKMREVLADPWAVWKEPYETLQKRQDETLKFDLKGATDSELASHWWEVWYANKFLVECHFYPMYALGQGNAVFRRVLKDLHGIGPADVEYATLHSGFENKYTRLTVALAEVARLAVDLNLRAVFEEEDLDVLLALLDSSENGQDWLKAFNQYVNDYGFVRLKPVEISSPTVWEDPKIALEDIRRYVTAGAAGDKAAEARAEMTEKRKKLEQELVEKTPPEEREVFRKLMECSQASAVFSEEHNTNIEMLGLSITRLVAMELGRRFAESGAIDEPEDVMFLLHNEIGDAAVSYRKSSLRQTVERRKAEYADYRSTESTVPMFFGDPAGLAQLAEADPIFSILGAPQVASPEEVGANLVGCAGAPGVVEGTAVVCMGMEEMKNITPGCILVTPAVTPSWTPVFNIIAGLVTDGGGYLSHSLILAREFGIPGVVGTNEASRMIRTGQKIKVDGNLCRVHVID